MFFANKHVTLTDHLDHAVPGHKVDHSLGLEPVLLPSLCLSLPVPLHLGDQVEGHNPMVGWIRIDINLVELSLVE